MNKNKSETLQLIFRANLQHTFVLKMSKQILIKYFLVYYVHYRLFFKAILELKS